MYGGGGYLLKLQLSTNKSDPKAKIIFCQSHLHVHLYDHAHI